MNEIIKNRMMLFFRDSPRVLCCPCTIKMAIPQKIYIDVYFVILQKEYTCPKSRELEE